MPRDGTGPRAALPAGVAIVRARGRVYVYAWRGGPRLLAPPGSARFQAEYEAAIAARRARPPVDAIAGLVLEFEKSRDFAMLAKATQADHRRAFAAILAAFGDAPLAAFEDPRIRRDLRQWRDGFAEPRRADKLLASFSRILSFAVADGYLARNPALDIGARYQRATHPAPVSAADIARTIAAPTTPPQVARAIRVMAASGLARADAASLAWSHVRPDRIEKRRVKSKVRAMPPMTAELAAALADCPKIDGVMTVLTTPEGRPWRADRLGKAIVRAFRAAGVAAATPHDLRASYACGLMRAGATDEEAAEACGWTVETVRHIRRHYVDDEAIFAGRIAKFARPARDEQ
jgi:integrase